MIFSQSPYKHSQMPVYKSAEWNCLIVIHKLWSKSICNLSYRKNCLFIAALELYELAVQKPLKFIVKCQIMFIALFASKIIGIIARQKQKAKCWRNRKKFKQNICMLIN